MPFFRYQCPKCLLQARKFLEKREGEPPPSKCECGQATQWVYGQPQTMIKEVLDNGIMPRSVERLKDIEELIHERHKVYKPKDGEIV